MATTTVDISEVKRDLERFIARAKAGEIIVIVRHGVPQAKIMPPEQA